MPLAALIWAGRPWLPVAGVLFAGAIAILAWAYHHSSRSGRALRAGCALLKGAAIAALALCLLEPLWSGQRAQPGANLFAIVADNSQSLQITDRKATRTRGEELQRLLAARPGGWQESLAGSFDLRRYWFDTRLEATGDFGGLAFDGRASALGLALRTLADRFRNRPLAGALVFTDGNATDWKTTLPPEVSGLPPIYPVIVGDGPAPRDLAVEQAQASQTAFEDSPVTIQAQVSAADCAGRAAEARVISETGAEIARSSQTPRRDNDTLSFRFPLKPDKAGLEFFDLRVNLAAEKGPTGEATLANNHRVVAVNRGEGPHRILYISGRPNWEFKFLRRAAEADPQLDLVGLIRVAKREPKFDFRGRAGETSNPLFRGSAKQGAEEVERYDQPVIVRLNTRDELELRNGFPRAPEDLYGFRAVIIADLESDFFAPDQAALLQKFVSERGGGLLMLGGMESFREGRYHRTPIGEMLPVYLDSASELESHGVVRLDLTKEGMLDAWARLRDTESAERARLAAMPGFQVLNQVREIKPGASVVATAQNAAGRALPALVIQRFGRGRTAALTIGDLWRWGFHDEASHADMDKAWRQMLRWLVADTPNPVELTAEPAPDEPNGTIRLETRVRDARFQPVDNATVMIEVTPVLFGPPAGSATNKVRLQAEPSLREPGLYEAAYVPRMNGGFRAAAFATNSVGAEVGRAQAGWSTDLAAEEFRSLTANTALLEALAQRTGGQVIRADQLDAFVRSLPQRRAPVMEAWSYPLWHTPALFGAALTCLLAEWGLRRWKGMP